MRVFVICSRALSDPPAACLPRSSALAPGAEDPDSTGGVGWLEGREGRGAELTGPARDVAGCRELGAGGGGPQGDRPGGTVVRGHQLGDGGHPARGAAGGGALEVDDRVDAAADEAADDVEPGTRRGQGHRLQAGRDLLGLPAWSVVRRPRWPVLAAWSMSSTSRPRTSPTIMRSGRMRRALRTSSRSGTSPRPSTLGGRASSRTTCGPGRDSSATSSMVTIRSRAGMAATSTFSRVIVL